MDDVVVRRIRTLIALALVMAACGSSTEATTTTTSEQLMTTTTLGMTTRTTASIVSTTSTTAPMPEAVVLDNPVIRLTLPEGIITDWNTLVAVGEGGWVVIAGDETEKGVPGDPGFWSTSDGVDWKVTRLADLVSIDFVEITDLVHFDGGYVASLMGDASIVDPTIVVSDDGVDWAAKSIRVGSAVAVPGAFATPESPPWPGASAITDMAVHDGELTAVGWVQTDEGSSPAVWRTTDAETWSRSLLPNQVSPNEWANEVAIGDAGYLVTGLGPFHQPDYLWASADGETWKPVVLTKDWLFGHHPAVADDMWAVLTFDDGRQEAYRSASGVDWEQVAFPDVPTPQQSWGREMLASGDEWLMVLNVEGQAGWMVSSAGETFHYPLGINQHFAEVYDHDVLVAQSNDEVEIMPVYVIDAARVVDVASDDVLNVRAGPGVGFEIVATLEPQAIDIFVVDRAENGWRFILGPTGQVGWVNGVFLGLEAR